MLRALLDTLEPYDSDEDDIIIDKEIEPSDETMRDVGQLIPEGDRVVSVVPGLGKRNRRRGQVGRMTAFWTLLREETEDAGGMQAKIV